MAAHGILVPPVSVRVAVPQLPIRGTCPPNPQRRLSAFPYFLAQLENTRHRGGPLMRTSLRSKKILMRTFAGADLASLKEDPDADFC